MTLGPKFFCCSKMAVTRRRSKLWWRTAHQSKALVKTYLSTVSKHDLKPSGMIFFFENLHAALDSHVPVFLDFCPWRVTKVRSLQCKLIVE